MCGRFGDFWKGMWDSEYCGGKHILLFFHKLMAVVLLKEVNKIHK